VIVVVGLSHRSAPIGVRELLAIPRDVAQDLLKDLTRRDAIGEAMLISTCNRVEVVAAGRDAPHADLEQVANEISSALTERAPGVAGNLYARLGAEGVRHLFRVASSLDSLVLGEPQILGQVKDAFEQARTAGTVGNVLYRTVPRAIRAAKRVRSETTIGTGQVSVPTVAQDLARQIFGELKGRSAMLVGSGEMAETVARLLATAGARLTVVGRNELRVAELVRSVGGEGRGWNELAASLVEADVVITSTSAPGTVIDLEHVKRVRRRRRGRSLFFIDLAVPRDVDPRVEGMDGVFLYNIDDLSRVVAESLSSRRREAERAEQIILLETRGYERWRDAEQVTPTILALRTRFASVLQHELERSLHGKLKHLGAEERAALDKMCEAALNKMLHAPTAHLRHVAAERGLDGASAEQLVAALSELFGLEDAVASSSAGAAQSDDEAPAGAASEESDARTVEPATIAGNGGR
jgi:glutamyl-tRNA reductase